MFNVILQSGVKQTDISDLVDIKKDFVTKELSLQNSKELAPANLTFKASRRLSLITGELVESLNDLFIEITDEFGRSVWAGFIDDIKEDKKGTLTVKSLNFAGRLSNLDLKTALVFDGATNHFPTDVIKDIWDETGLNVPAKFFDRLSFDNVKAVTGETLQPLFEEGTKALDAIQEMMMCGGFMIFTHKNVLRARVIQTDTPRIVIETKEIIGFPEFSFNIDEMKTSIKGFSAGAVAEEKTLTAIDVFSLGFRPFILKQIVTNTAMFDSIATRIFNLFGASQNQAVLQVGVDLDWIDPGHKAKYYDVQLYDFITLHTPALKIDGLVIDKQTKGGKAALKIRGVRWVRIPENAVDFRFESNALIFEPDANIQYEVFIGSRWQVFNIKQQPFFDIGGFPNPVHVRFRTFKNNCFSEYVNLKLIVGSVFIIGIKEFEITDIDNLLLESGDNLLYEWGGFVQI